MPVQRLRLRSSSVAERALLHVRRRSGRPACLVGQPVWERTREQAAWSAHGRPASSRRPAQACAQIDYLLFDVPTFGIQVLAQVRGGYAGPGCKGYGFWETLTSDRELHHANTQGSRIKTGGGSCHVIW